MEAPPTPLATPSPASAVRRVHASSTRAWGSRRSERETRLLGLDVDTHVRRRGEVIKAVKAVRPVPAVAGTERGTRNPLDGGRKQVAEERKKTGEECETATDRETTTPARCGISSAQTESSTPAMPSMPTLAYPTPGSKETVASRRVTISDDEGVCVSTPSSEQEPDSDAHPEQAQEDNDEDANEEEEEEEERQDEDQEEKERHRIKSVRRKLFRLDRLLHTSRTMLHRLDSTILRIRTLQTSRRLARDHNTTQNGEKEGKAEEMEDEDEELEEVVKRLCMQSESLGREIESLEIRVLVAYPCPLFLVFFLSWCVFS
jgi:hypothetical protein